MGSKQVQKQRCPSPFHCICEVLLMLTFRQPSWYCKEYGMGAGANLQLSDKALAWHAHGPGSIPRTAERVGKGISPREYF